MSDMSMRPLTDPVSGREDPERPSAAFDSDMAPRNPRNPRDSQTDARTMSEAAGQMSDELDMAGYLVTGTGRTTIMDEKRDRGWTPLTEPVGAEPADGSTSGTRGAADIRGT